MKIVLVVIVLISFAVGEIKDLEPPDCLDEARSYYSKGCSSQYYMCSENEVTTLNCPKGLYFNGHTETCTEKRKVKQCVQGGQQEQAAKEEFDCESQPDRSYLPVGSSGCSDTFFSCSNGITFGEVCTSGKVFDPERQICVSKEKVNACRKEEAMVSNSIDCPNLLTAEGMPCNEKHICVQVANPENGRYTCPPVFELWYGPVNGTLTEWTRAPNGLRCMEGRWMNGRTLVSTNGADCRAKRSTIESVMEERIVNGNVAPPNKYPSVVQIIHYNSTAKMNYHVCTGTIISTKHILSAAHCFKSFNKASEYHILAGGYTYMEGSSHRIHDFKHHPNYTRVEFCPNCNDLAVASLLDPLHISSVVSIEIFPEKEQEIPAMCTVAGWGQNQDFKKHKHLHEADLSILEEAECRNRINARSEFEKRKYNATIMMCTFDRGEKKGTCHGDSGGPLMCTRHFKRFQQGIVSYTPWGNCDPKSPHIFTKVFPYLKWIKRTVEEMTVPW